MAEWLRTGLQIREHRFDSGPRLQFLPDQIFPAPSQWGAGYVLCQMFPAASAPLQIIAGCFKTAATGGRRHFRSHKQIVGRHDRIHMSGTDLTYLRTWTLMMFTSLTLWGCSRTELPPVTGEIYATAEIPGYPGVRSWGDVSGTAGDTGPVQGAVLAISSGADNGAFGAGLLAGWSGTGTRPQFHTVTGVSVGSLIAPYAFLGAAQDEKLRELFTGLEWYNIVRLHSLTGLRNGGITDPAPLLEAIQTNLTPEILDAIAAEHRKGRRLLARTTHISSGRPLDWDLGAIAASGRADRLELFSKVLLASSAIPAAFPPIEFEVEAGGRRYKELHMDGFVTGQVFVPAGRWQQMFVILNNRLTPDFEQVNRRLPDLVSRYIYGVVRQQSAGDLARLYIRAQQAGSAFSYLEIPASVATEGRLPFQREYMEKLFETGVATGAGVNGAGPAWRSLPPR